MKKGRDARFSCKKKRGCGIQEPVFAICTFSSVHLICPPKILHNFFLKFLLGITLVPRKTENSAHRFYSKNAAALIKFFYGKMQQKNEGSVYFSESWTQNKICFNYGINTVKPCFTDTRLTGADPGFFLRGGALVSCSTTSTPINHIVYSFLQNTS